jgi:hypothetical protein
MPADPQAKPSFSPYRKWGIGLHVCLILLVILSVVVMVNYLSRDYFLRLHLSGRTRNPLMPRTVKLLESLTNQVKVTVYYDKDEALYSTVVDLLNEYRTVNSKITLRTVDYLRDPGTAQKIKADYKNYLAAASDKDVVIFDCGGKVKVVDGKMLAQYALEKVPDGEKPYRRRLTSFAGEQAFTATLIAVTNPKLKAYFLTGHGEHPFDGTGELDGYLQFTSVVQQNYVGVEPLTLLGTNAVPMDCNLLVIAGPTTALLEPELQKIEQYLNQGGRMFALFNSRSAGRETGLEKVLAKWGVDVGANVVVDPDHSTSGNDVIVSAFSGKHPVVNPLLGQGLYLIQPRAVGKLNLRAPPADLPPVEVVAETGPRSYLSGNSAGPARSFPVMVALEKRAVKDVAAERGTTRMIVVGDSMFLGNNQINVLGNRDFAGCAINWLLERTQLVEGLGARPVTEYRLVMTRSQLQGTQWILLAGMPGAVLVLGGLVWLSRRR